MSDGTTTTSTTTLEQLRDDLASYVRNVACRRLERDDDFEARLRAQIAEAEAAEAA